MSAATLSHLIFELLNISAASNGNSSVQIDDRLIYGIASWPNSDTPQGVFAAFVRDPEPEGAGLPTFKDWTKPHALTYLSWILYGAVFVIQCLIYLCRRLSYGRFKLSIERINKMEQHKVSYRMAVLKAASPLATSFFLYSTANQAAEKYTILLGIFMAVDISVGTCYVHYGLMNYMPSAQHGPDLSLGIGVAKNDITSQYATKEPIHQIAYLCHLLVHGVQAGVALDQIIGGAIGF